MKTFKELVEAKKKSENPEDYPMVHDFGADEGEPREHPIVNEIRQGKKVESHKIVHEFRDDHEHCVACHTKVGGKVHKYSQWWITNEHLKLHHQAEVSDKHRAKLGKSLVKDADSMKSQHDEHMKSVMKTFK